MDIWTFIGFMGIIFTSSQTIPQIIKSIKSRQLRDLSFGLCTIVSGSSMCWLAYGVHLGDTAIITANLINLTGALFLLFLKLRYELKLKKIEKQKAIL